MHVVNSQAADGGLTAYQTPNCSTSEGFENRLVSAVQNGSRPIAFVIGSGLSLSAVPGVRETVGQMRFAVGLGLRAQFDRDVKGLTGASLYSAAANFVFHNLGRSELNAVVRSAVISAYMGDVDTSADPYVLEEDVAGWHLPKGCAALGSIVAAIPAARRGPILTTNFDPLLEISLARAGLHPEPVALERDGRVNHVRSGSTRVVHVHGYWRDSDTLHLVPQLGVARPQVEEQIRRSLAGCDVFVLGYSGWDDVIMRTLLTRVAVGGYDDMDVLWSMFGPRNDEPTGTNLAKLLDDPVSVAVYEGVDANEVLPSAKRRCLRRAAASGAVKPASTPGSVSAPKRLMPPATRPPIRLSEKSRGDIRGALKVSAPSISLAETYKDHIAAAQRVTREFNG